MTSWYRCSARSRSLSRCSPEVAQADALGQRSQGELTDRIGDQHLAAVGGRGDACRTVDVEAHVVAIRERRLAGMDAHAHAHLHALWPVVRREGALRHGRRLHRVAGSPKDHEEGIALGRDLDAAAGTDGLPDEPVVVRQQLTIGGAELLQQAGRALDVGEQECDGPGRTFAHRFSSGVCCHHPSRTDHATVPWGP